MSRIKVAIDFRVGDPRQGIGTALLALAHGLATHGREDQEYVFLVNEGSVNWLSPHLSGNCSVVSIHAPRQLPDKPVTQFGGLRGWIKKLPGVRPAVLEMRSWPRKIGNLLRLTKPQVDASDGLAEALGCDMVHFPSQGAYTTNLPSIYQPWDLQHCHLPQFFSKEELQRRDVLYRRSCREARAVCVSTEWGKADLVAQYGLDPAKIEVIRFGTAFEAYTPPSQSEIEEVRRELGLPQTFMVFPAVTWPHKNHENLIRGLSVMKRNYNMAVEMYFTGAPTELESQLKELTVELGLQDTVHFLGFVSSTQIQAIFRLATAMIFPSKFEGLGLPVLEAFRAGLPVACSSATVLPEVAGDGAVFFDPDSPEEIAAAIKMLIESPELRANLVERGYKIVEGYSALAAAKQFAVLYDRIVRPVAGKNA
jgi:glycosyltransferase involved in cell wall biosynthesis